jgi:hypothetical protein
MRYNQGEIISFLYVANELYYCVCLDNVDEPTKYFTPLHYKNSASSATNCPVCGYNQTRYFTSIFEEDDGFVHGGLYCHQCGVITENRITYCLSCGHTIHLVEGKLVCSYCGEHWEEGTIRAAYELGDQLSIRLSEEEIEKIRKERNII